MRHLMYLRNTRSLFTSKKFPRTSFHINENKWKRIEFANCSINSKKKREVADYVIITPLEKTCVINIDMGKVTTNDIEIYNETIINVKDNCFYVGKERLMDDVWFFDWVINAKGKFKVEEIRENS